MVKIPKPKNDYKRTYSQGLEMNYLSRLTYSLSYLRFDPFALSTGYFVLFFSSLLSIIFLTSRLYLAAIRKAE